MGTQPCSPGVNVADTLSDMYESLAAYKARMDKWSQELLEPYLRRLARHRPPYEAAKEFNDPVWGTLQLRPDEVVLLDSPLLQRLRRIRQLGVVHYVYPAATHTRLEHSLGVLHQVQQLVTTINETRATATGRGSRMLTDAHERILRLAALCHDVGHGAMSHVSEYALDSDRGCSDIRMDFQRDHKKSTPNQLSEIAAYFILDSTAFQDLLEQVQRLCAPIQIDDLAAKLQKIIIGVPADPQVPLLHELVSGPFDADKLDYLTRDALMCGVPMVADVPRLVRKVRAVHVDRVRLPAEIRKLVSDQPSGYVVTGIARSGARTLEEMALARTLMFDKIYRHQKVRAAEAMVFSLIRQLQKVLPYEPGMLPLWITDDELLALTHESISERARTLGAPLTVATRPSVDAAAYLARRLRDRRLFTRGFAFADRMPGDDYRDDKDHRAGLLRLVVDCEREDVREDLVRDLIERMSSICELTGQAELLGVPGGHLEPYIWISAPKAIPNSASAELGHACLIDENGAILPASEEVGEGHALADAYVASRDLGYIFSLRRLSPIVYVAAEALVRERYDIRMPDAMQSYAKQDSEKIVALKRRLEEARWYELLPGDLRPLPSVLTRSDAIDRADEIVSRLAGYSGPYQSPSPGDARPASTISRQKVLSYARQFVDDDLVNSALTVMNSIMVIGRAEANQALDAFLKSHNEFEGASYCALGEGRDSSALLTYYVGDMARFHGLVYRTLEDALAHDKPIVFVDDLVGRGSQSISILETWLGVKLSEDLHERRNATLPPDLVEKMRGRRLGFVFVAGMSEGRAALEARAGELELKLTVYVHIPESRLPFLHQVIREQATLERFKSFCVQKAKPVLLSPEEGHDDTWVGQRVLGYGNTGLLLASTYNTPSATLTCLWAEDAQKSPWNAFLRRRKKT